MTSTRSFRGSASFVWDINKPLGQGATSFVYMGRNKRTGDEVAVKVFNTMSLQRPMAVQIREFEVMRKLNHDNIVKMIAVEQEVPNGVDVLIMEYCTHGTLFTLLESPENNFGLSEEEFINVVQQVTEGIKHLRDSDIIHRDIKPGNILRSVMPDGRSVYKLTDFGAARELQQDEEFHSLYGTDEYLHPDMYERAVLRRPRGQNFGLYVDLWSLGVTFYHAATGNLPFRPFGGRRNKETMHQITTRKEYGVISGVQLREGGPVEWSRDLPSTCRLSRGLKSLVTPLLVCLLEKDQTKTLSFEQFFTQVNDITSRMPYHIFCPSAFSMLTVYVRAQDDMSQVRQMITDQMEIPGGAQLLLHDGKVLTSETREPIVNLFHNDTKENPMFLLNKLPEYKNFRKPSVGVFPEIPIQTNVDADYSLSKKCLAVLHSMRNAVRSLKSITEHMHRVVKMYSDLVDHRYEDMERTLRQVSQAYASTETFKEQLFQLVAVEGSLFKSLSQVGPASVLVHANQLNTLQQTGYQECSHLSKLIQTDLEKTTSVLGDVKKSLSGEVSWDRKVGCQPCDRCPEKMDVLISRLHKITSSFKEDRNRRLLNNNEEQIHRVDKNKMKELTITAKTLLEDHCIGKCQALFSTFKKFYSKKVQINDTVEKMSGDLVKTNELHARLMEKLKISSEDCVTQAKTSIKETEKFETEKESNTVPKQINPGDTRPERLGEVLNSLQSWSENLMVVKQLLNENNQMISKFGEQCAFEAEEDKSWEMIGNNTDTEHQA